MEIEEPPPLRSGHSLPTVGSTCFIPAKQNGLASLIIQFVILLVSGMTVLFFFYHVGGYEYMGWNENSTIWEPVYNHGKHSTSPLSTTTTVTTTTVVFELEHIEEMVKRDIVQILDSSADTIDHFINETRETLDNYTNSFQPLEDIFSMTLDNETDAQIPETVIYIGDAQLDMLEMIRISTLAYIVLGILWFCSLILLLLSIKFEIIDMVVVNAICLTAAIMYLFIHAVFIAVLLYYRRDLPLRSMLIVIGSAVLLFITVALGAVCLALVVGWYKYIIYMNDGEKCYCLGLCVGIIKGERHEPPSRAQEYAMREAGRNPNEISYTEPPIQNFSQF